MDYISVPFLCIILPLFFLFYYLLKGKARVIFLSIFSLLFWTLQKPIYGLIILFIILIDYMSAKEIEKYRVDRTKKELFFIVSILIQLGLWFVLFTSEITLQSIIFSISITLVIISSITYMLDVYKGHIHFEKDIFYLSSYFALFPRIFLGRFMRYEEVKKSLELPKENRLKSGFMYAFQGVLKSVFLGYGSYMIFEMIAYDNIHITVVTSYLAAFFLFFGLYYIYTGLRALSDGLLMMLGFDIEKERLYSYKEHTWMGLLKSLYPSIFHAYKIERLVKKATWKQTIIFAICLPIIFTLMHPTVSFFLLGVVVGGFFLLEKTTWITKQNVIIHHMMILLVIFFGGIWLFHMTPLEYFKVMTGFGNVPFVTSYLGYIISNYFIILLLDIILMIPLYPYVKRIKFPQTRYTKLAVTVVTLLINLLLLFLFISTLLRISFC